MTTLQYLAALRKQEGKKMCDLRIGGHGTIYTITPVSDEGHRWIDEHVDAPGFMWLGKSLCVEHRYIGDIVQGAVWDGLEVK